MCCVEGFCFGVVLQGGGDQGKQGNKDECDGENRHHQIVDQIVKIGKAHDVRSYVFFLLYLYFAGKR